DGLRVRAVIVFEWGAHGYGLKRRADALNRRFQTVKRLLLDPRRQLGSEPADGHGLMGDHRAAPAAHGGADGVDVEWLERARVDYLRIDSLRGQSAGGLHSLADHPRRRDDRQVVAAADAARAADLDPLGLIRDCWFSAEVQRVVLDEHDRTGI